jgi:histidine triad (HIT) family protein
MGDCIFCKIVKGEVSPKLEGENDCVIAFKSINPVSEQHILIVPKQHVVSFMDLKDEHKDLFMGMAKMAKELIKKKKISEGYKLVFNGGKYQSVKHLHWHLLGGKLEDESDILNKT